MTLFKCLTFHFRQLVPYYADGCYSTTSLLCSLVCNCRTKAFAIRRIVTLTIVTCLFCSAESSLEAQERKEIDARTVAALVQSFYDQTATISASFFQTYVHKLYRKTDRSKGKVFFQKPGLMRWNYGSPNGKVIVSDGHRFLAYEPGEGDEPGQIFEQKISEAQLPQALAFLMGTGRLEENFSFRLLDSQKEGFTKGYVLELRPLEASPHYDRIIFYVERHVKLRGLVRRVLIIDPEGNRNRFDFNNPKFNRKMSDELFSWKPPPGTIRIGH